MNTDSRRKEPPDSPSDVQDKVLLDLANALTALGNHLAVATRIRPRAGRSGADDSLDQVLEQSRAQHERAVGALRELRKVLQR
jgi:hypothetical protein